MHISTEANCTHCEQHTSETLVPTYPEAASPHLDSVLLIGSNRHYGTLDRRSHAGHRNLGQILHEGTLPRLCFAEETPDTPEDVMTLHMPTSEKRKLIQEAPT